MSSRRGVLFPQEPRKVSRGRINAARLLALAVMAMLLWPHPADAAAWYSNLWTYRKAIVIDHSQVPNTDQTNFPVLINLASDSGLRAHAQTTGNDILFTSSDGITKIPYEREIYTSGTGALVAWVQVPTLSHTADTIVYMYYGGPGASDQQQKTSVWDTNYKMVYHLGDAGPTTAADSTTNGINGTQSGGVTFGAAGQIDGAAAFNGTTQYLQMATVNLGGSQTAIEGWINVTAFQGASPFISTIAGEEGTGTDLLRLGDATLANNKLQFVLDFGGTQFKLNGVAGLNTGTWYHVAATYNGSQMCLYVNGTQDACQAQSGSFNANSAFFVSNSSGGRELNGKIDEVRVSTVARSADWIKTEYNNQSSPGTFYNVSGATAWYSASWTNRKQIIIHHAQVPNTDQSNFPVLINLASDAGLPAHAQATGNDILFTLGDGVTQTPYEREKYTSGTGALVAWVKVPTLSHTADTVLYMYYGNPAASDQQQRTSVWDSNFKLVYHLGDAGSPALDSTSNGNNGTQFGGVTFGATGQMDGATTYANGATTPIEYVDTTSAPALNPSGSFTYRLWINVTGTVVQAANTGDPSGSYFLDRTAATAGNPLVSLIAVTGSHFGYQTRYDDGTGLGGPSGGTFSSSFALVEMVREFNTAFRLYVNGTLVASTTDSGSKTLTPPIPQLGRHATFTTGTPGLNGSIDEFRIQSVARNADWILTEYNNESSPGTFYSVGGEQTFSSAGVGEQVRPRNQIL